MFLNRNSERIPRSLLRGLASELQQITPFLAWKIPCTLVQGASINNNRACFIGIFSLNRQIKITNYLHVLIQIASGIY